MPDSSGLEQPYFQPQLTPDWLDAQRKQQIAQMLMSSLQSANQTPADWNSMKVVPKRGMLQNVSVLADALLARKGLDASQQATSDYYQKLYGPQKPAAPAPSGPGAGIVSPDAPPDQQAAAQAVTDIPAGSGAAPSSGLVQQPQNPMIPRGMSPQVATMAMNASPGEYVKVLMGTPEWQTALAANNGNAQAAMAQLQAEARVKGTMHMRQGEDIALPNGQTIRNPVLGPGETLTRDAQGNPQSVSLIPGAADAAGTMKGAQTAADVANTPRMVPQGGGSERLMYPGDLSGTGLPPALRTATPAPQAPQAPQQPNVSQGRPPQAPAQSLPGQSSAPVAPTWDGAWNSVPKLKVPATPGQTSNTFQSGQLTNAVKKDSELVDTYGTETKDADRRLQYNAQAMQALPNAEVGPMSEWMTNNRSKLKEWGVPDSLIPGSGQTITPTLELNKNLKNAALQNARQNFPKLTQAETFLQTEELSPSASMTRDAIGALIRQDNMQAQYAKQRASDYQRFRNGGGDPTQFENWYAQNRPLSRFASQADTPPAALARVHANPELLPAFKRTYGWDPST